MGRLLFYIALATLACRLVTGRWPWEFLAPPRRTTPADRAREVLGVSAGATREEILAAHRRLVSRVHPDRGGSGEATLEANAARDVLLAQLNHDPN